MFFFINQTIPDRVTGIESAQYKRLAMLKRKNISAKLVTLRYNGTYALNLATYQLEPADVINMYDYFCEIAHMPVKPVRETDLNLADFSHKAFENGEKIYYLDKKPLLKVFVNKDEMVTKVNYYGSNRNSVRNTIYDVRGFKSSETFFDEAIVPVRQNYFSPDGQVRLSVRYQKNQATKENVVRDVYYYPRGKRLEHFTDLVSLQSYFYDRLNADYVGENIFVADRTLPVGWGLTHMTTKAFKLFHVHSSHVNQLEYPLSDNFNTHYRYAFKNLPLWNGMIASTQAQVAHLRAKFPTEEIFPASVSIIPNELLNRAVKPFEARTPYKIIVAARIEAGKRIDEMIEIVALVKKQIPEVTLDIWGLTSNAEVEKKLHELVDTLDLADTVSFKGYTSNMPVVYDQAMLLMVASTYEGTALVIAESLAYGVPVLAYDFSYGPREFIHDGENGFIVSVNDRKKAAEQVVDLMTDENKWRQMSRTAHLQSVQSSEDKIVKDWQAMMRAAHTFYEGGEK